MVVATTMAEGGKPQSLMIFVHEARCCHLENKSVATKNVWWWCLFSHLKMLAFALPFSPKCGVYSFKLHVCKWMTFWPFSPPWKTSHLLSWRLHIQDGLVHIGSYLNSVGKKIHLGKKNQTKIQRKKFVQKYYPDFYLKKSFLLDINHSW